MLRASGSHRMIVIAFIVVAGADISLRLLELGPRNG
jgi:hypothetical protein